MEITAPSQAALSITFAAKRFLYFVAYVKPGGAGVDFVDLQLRFNGDAGASYNWLGLKTLPTVYALPGVNTTYIRCDGRMDAAPLSNNFLVGEIENMAGGFKLVHLRCTDMTALSDDVTAIPPEFPVTARWNKFTAPSAKDSQVTTIEISKVGATPTILQGSYILVYGSD